MIGCVPSPPAARIDIRGPRQLVATIGSPRLVGVEMTCVSAGFGEPIKDGLWCALLCGTEGARRPLRHSEGKDDTEH